MSRDIYFGPSIIDAEEWDLAVLLEEAETEWIEKDEQDDKRK